MALVVKTGAIGARVVAGGNRKPSAGVGEGPGSIVNQICPDLIELARPALNGR